MKQLNAHSQRWPRVVPNSGALPAALSWLQLLSLSTEKGQVPFGASVGVVSFFTTLGTAGGEGRNKRKTLFQRQFTMKTAPTKYQVGDRDSEISVVVIFIQTQGRGSSRRYSSAEPQPVIRQTAPAGPDDQRAHGPCGHRRGSWWGRALAPAQSLT